MTDAPSRKFQSQAIIQKMDALRSDMDDSALAIVEGVRELRDWRSYVKAYPWVALGGAFAVGYWLVPKPKANFRSIARKLDELVHVSSSLDKPALPSNSAAFSRTALSFVGGLVMRGIAAYVAQRTGQHFTQTAKTRDEQQV